MKYCIICEKNGIKKSATYGDINDNTAKYCADCSKDVVTTSKIVNYKHGYCQYIFDGKICGNNANFNYIDCKVKKGIRCNIHKDESMICINGHLCKDCKRKQASFIDISCNLKTPTHCRECANKYIEKSFKDVSHKQCKECNSSSAIYGIKGSNIKEYCKKCINKLNIESDDLHHKKCIICNNKNASFNIDGETALYCGDCKDNNMSLTYKKKCIKCNDTSPSYNYIGDKNPLYCMICKEDDMINVINDKCIECNIKRPSYNFEGDKKPLYCKTCIDKINSNDKINVYKDYCEYDNCNEYAWYNYEGTDIVLYCKDHAKPDMINILGNLCKEKGCNKSAIFHYPSEVKGIYCVLHCKDGMIDVKHKKCLLCGERARFNNYGETSPLYCNLHKTELMISLEHKLCKTYLCGKRAIDKYENYCMTCYIRLFPDKPVSRNYKTKESNVIQYILNTFKDLTWIVDRPVYDGCSLKRPDLLLDLGYQVINIEIDENQHKSYEEICENKRLMMISQDIQHRNLILIRFNPDGYTKNNGHKVLSCWTNGTKGLSTIKLQYKKQWDERLKKLENTIEYWLNPENISDKMINIIHLYFDEI